MSALTHHEWIVGAFQVLAAEIIDGDRQAEDNAHRMRRSGPADAVREAEICLYELGELFTAGELLWLLERLVCHDDFTHQAVDRLREWRLAQATRQH